MPRYLVVLAAAALAALLITAAAPAQGSGRVIRFLEVDSERNTVFIDTNRNEPSGEPFVGDSFMERLKLYAWANGGGRGERIGRAEIMCTFAGRGRGFCRGTFFLPGGTIEGQGYSRLAIKVKLAVTGGTGVYAGARGTFTSRQIRDTFDADGNFVSISADVIRLLP